MNLVRDPFTSSIWPAVRSTYMNLLEEIIWIVGTDSDVKFWTDNWVGYPLNSKINIPSGLQVEAKVGGFHLQKKWVLPEVFRRLFPGIVWDIEHVTVAEGCKDEIIWSPYSTGFPRTKDFYEHLRSKDTIINWGTKIWRRGT
ncbi:hypothetical protein TIFTF001_023909 [Ficus carica]|uniref:Uncharacterized protein n=1 Tax=Ficus carica TaxID=3494 RepID=A0AA88AP87_FICCA|nr:hypothetical protein TIFTF001_023909 [Ficus carica]